jgi:hypothetical protein
MVVDLCLWCVEDAVVIEEVPLEASLHIRYEERVDQKGTRESELIRGVVMLIIGYRTFLFFTI